MSCRELVELVTDYLEGGLSHDERSRLEEHLRECRYCVEYVEQMRQTIEALGGLGEESLAPGTRRELLEAFRVRRDR
jgi:anti-sigma factor RsiW